MTEPSDALRKQLASDAGPHATPDQERAAEKRRAAAGTGAARTDKSAPVGRRSRSKQDG